MKKTNVKTPCARDLPFLPVKGIWKTPSFPWLIPQRFIDKINTFDFNDPIFAQFVPSILEKKKIKGFLQDPLHEKKYQTGVLIQKYHHRALLCCSASCAMHCRFCFRKNQPKISTHNFDKELQRIEENRSLSEIILSGGDPLMLPDTIFQQLLQNLDNIPHITRIRIHTRMPLAHPERISAQFLKILTKSQKQLIVVLHTNHAQELDEAIFSSMHAIASLGIPIFSQSVLLRGVNDTVEDLKTLCFQLIDHGIIPYYLHQLDKAEGTHHFQVSKSKGKKIMQELQAELPGYALFRYVQDISGKRSKTALYP
ncbi:MAG: KamA family radical SAM protein [Parachlamydiales bacterium]|nr:KamA family radical SAM protein [Parachlamydiales bacterium]